MEERQLANNQTARLTELVMLTGLIAATLLGFGIGGADLRNRRAECPLYRSAGE